MFEGGVITLLFHVVNVLLRGQIKSVFAIFIGLQIDDLSTLLAIL